MKPVRTAVILAAGRGTRRLPISRVVDKAMLPIANRPVVDYVVEQCVRAGIDHIVFIVATPESLLKKYYDNQFEVANEYPWLKLEKTITCQYVMQSVSDNNYGTAAAVGCVERYISDDSFVVMPADGFIYNNNDESLVQHLIDIFTTSIDCKAVLGGLTVSAEEASLYSTIEHSDDYQLTNLVEKPRNLDLERSYLANVSYYVVSRDIFNCIKAIKPVNGEYYLTDAVLDLAHRAKVVVAPLSGKYLDSGQLTAWIDANNHMTNH